MATETDAARDRVLAARAALSDELEVLEASVRAAVDVPAKIRRSPARAAAIVGSVGFLALGGPKRLFRAGKRAIVGAPPPLPPSMLPKQIEKSLRKLGDDGDKVRGTLERDFAAYAREANNRRQALGSLALAALARPLLTRGAKTAVDWLFRNDAEGFQARLTQVRARASRQAGRDASSEGPDDRSATAEARDKTAADEAAGSAGA